jgi:hypothetical protein
MGIMKQANKLKGEERERFLEDYYAARNRLKMAQVPEKQKKKRVKKKDLNGPVTTYRLED